MSTAKPDSATKRTTALCRNCGEVIYKNPYGPWEHDDTGSTICPPEDERQG